MMQIQCMYPACVKVATIWAMTVTYNNVAYCPEHAPSTDITVVI